MKTIIICTSLCNNNHQAKPNQTKPLLKNPLREKV